ncbi:hypothetical protein BKA80DRAFT_303319 [Phyllosticta citrichinensis]
MSLQKLAKTSSLTLVGATWLTESLKWKTPAGGKVGHEHRWRQFYIATDVLRCPRIYSSDRTSSAEQAPKAASPNHPTSSIYPSVHYSSISTINHRQLTTHTAILHHLTSPHLTADYHPRRAPCGDSTRLARVATLTALLAPHRRSARRFRRPPSTREAHRQSTLSYYPLPQHENDASAQTAVGRVGGGAIYGNSSSSSSSSDAENKGEAYYTVNASFPSFVYSQESSPMGTS